MTVEDQISFSECPLFENRDVIFDVSVTHPVRDGPMVGNACVPGEAATIREKTKIDKQERDTAARGMKFVPLFFETLGYVTEPVVQLIKILAERIAEKANSPYSVVVTYWYIRISAALQKGNARIIQNADDQLKSGESRS
jgi:hypothetical protein